MSTAEALERRSRRRGRRKLLWEAVIVLGATAVAALVVYLVYRHPIGSPWKVAGTHVQDISNQVGIQTEAAVAADPSNAKVLFGASNENLEPEVRVYASHDSGRTWSEAAGPLHDPNSCSWGDPAVAVARDGRQYVAYTEKSICAPGPDLTPYLVVGSRTGNGGWTVRRVARPATNFGFDDKPAISVDAAGRAYVAWSRYYGGKFQTTVVSSSADGGRTWSKPLMVQRRLVQPQLVTIAAGPRGVVYLAGVDGKGLWVARSTDAGKSFTVKQGVAPLPGNQAATCLMFGKFVLAQQTTRCLGPNPTITLARDRVFVTYGVNGADRTQDVAVAVFDRALRPVWRGPIGSVKKKADQFWPASAVDASTGKLWACYYDTTGDSQRQHAWFVCTSSRDGKNWAEPVRAAEPSQNPGVLWQDATIGGYADSAAYGGYPAVAAAGGVVHPLWIDTRDVGGNREEVFASNIR
jgi:BNR repeat-like domain